MLQNRRLRLIGYVRLGDTLISGIEQLNAIKDYCRVNRHECVTVCNDEQQPAFGLSRALEHLKHADGLITYDATRLVHNMSDTYRELRPLVEAHFLHGHKKLITIADGIENVTVSGEENLIAMLNEWHRRTDEPGSTYDRAEHERFSVNQPF